MRDALKAAGKRNAVDLALVTFTTPAAARRYRDERNIDFPLLLDPERTSYRAYGLGSASLTRTWGLRVWRRYAEILRDQGMGAMRRFGEVTEDTRQLGGDFVIDADGTLTYAFRSQGPDDRPAVADLLAAL